MIALENLERLIMLPKSLKYFEVQLHAVYSCFVIQNYSEKKYYRNLPRKKRTENNKFCFTSIIQILVLKGEKVPQIITADNNCGRLKLITYNNSEINYDVLSLEIVHPVFTNTRNHSTLNVKRQKKRQ